MKKKPPIIEYEDGTRVMLDEDDIPELDAAWFRKAKRGLDGLAELVGDENVAPLRTVGRPKSASPKVNGTLRLSSEVWEGLKASGAGYNARVDALLKQALSEGRL